MRRFICLSAILSIIISCLLLIPLQAYSLEETTQEFTQAEQKFEAGDYANAEQWYRKAAEKYQTMSNLAAYIQSRIGECLQYQGSTEEAAQAYRTVQNDYPDSPLTAQMQEKIARVYYEAGEYAKAAPEFEKVSEQIAENDNSKVRATSVGESDVNAADNRNQALGYAAYCYGKAGKKVKAAIVKMKLKSNIKQKRNQ